MLSFLSVYFQIISKGHNQVLIAIETACLMQIDGKEEVNDEEDGLWDFFDGVFDRKQVGRDGKLFNRLFVGRNNYGGGRDGAEDVSNFDVSDREVVD